ncbi:genetic competence negative regulator [Hydrogenibacillus schlegelii]|uniref:genetic competence negative regulator n=1 Tax=Hydrogenibacillus schlegelii TaxID=1484 RepID=UPI00349FF8FA
MRIERIAPDKVRFFLTLDDLSERNIDKDDLWKDLPKVHELFNDMMEQAYYEVGFEVSGPVAVEVFALPSQGMVVVVSKASEESDGEPFDGETIEMEVTLETRDDIACAFRDFEHLLAAVRRVRSVVGPAGRLYHYKGHYVLYFEPLALDEAEYEKLVANLAEYGDIVPVTIHVLEEYGKPIIPERAVEVLGRYFGEGGPFVDPAGP